MELKVIDFSIMGGRVYVGRPNGKTARTYFKIDLCEEQKEYPIKVIFPINAKTLASSFFLGMFGRSVRQAGNRNEFLKRFHFEANKQIMSEIEDGILEALSAGE